MQILSIGTFTGKGISNTCLHRTWALEKLGNVQCIDSTLRNHKFLYRVINRLFVRYHLPVHFYDNALNREIIEQATKYHYDLVWIDKGILIQKKTLKAIKQLQPHCIIVGYSPDNMAERHNQSLLFLESMPDYDYYITTKSYTVETLKKMGCKNVLFVNNAYEDTFHHPYKLSEEERKRLGGKVGFIGAWEEERCRSILYLAQHGVPVRVWGGGKWLAYKGKYPNLAIEDKGLFSEDYNKALSAFDISLCFLRKMNFDQQTTRTMEIPACGSLLMAERTPEHLKLFEDEKEAVFFSSDQELLEKCQYYLTHEEERKRIAEAGYLRCMSSGYSNIETLKKVLSHIVQDYTTKGKNKGNENTLYL